MLATTLRRTASVAAAAARQTSTRCFASAPVDFEHFSSGWEKDSSGYEAEGKFHIETFNKISPQVSLYACNCVFVCSMYASTEEHIMSDLITCRLYLTTSLQVAI